MDATGRRIEGKFAAFGKTNDAGLVIEALEIVKAATRDVPIGDVAARKQAVSYWLLFLASLDRYVDPQWDPQRVPVKGVAPPPGHGVVHPSGEVDPATIPDPAARADYVRALKASSDYREWYLIQFQLRRLESDAVRSFELLLAERYSGSAQDRQELEELLAASPVSEARRDRGRAAMDRLR
jgi:hypothetical protein